VFGWHCAGYEIPPQYRAPILATSVTDFWSRRWNLNVRDWFHRNLFLPLKTVRRPMLGVVAAFGASALLHFWFIAVALGLYWGLMMASFFLIQAVFMLAEGRLRVRASPARRIWTIAAVAGTSPLFVEPCLRLFH
jgi:alginate O-acetyltransferase complex protein AlgI